mmetsp:Transcript_57676/g.163795  ORF Transcript_57676/g.163795 Transcript_57676/m.163795 type:complete len:179 (+) Transcript_57676:494-1030(+)
MKMTAALRPRLLRLLAWRPQWQMKLFQAQPTQYQRQSMLATPAVEAGQNQQRIRSKTKSEITTVTLMLQWSLQRQPLPMAVPMQQSLRQSPPMTGNTWLRLPTTRVAALPQGQPRLGPTGASLAFLWSLPLLSLTRAALLPWSLRQLPLATKVLQAPRVLLLLLLLPMKLALRPFLVL